MAQSSLPVAASNCDPAAFPGQHEHLLTRELCRRHLRPLLENHGYNALGSRQKVKCTHEISVYGEDYYDSGCEISVGARSRFHQVTDLYVSVACPEMSPKERKNASTTTLGQGHWMDEKGGFVLGFNKEYRVERAADTEAMLQHLCAKVESRLLPLLEQYKTLDGLDKLLNPEPVLASMFFTSYANGMNQILTAYLADDPRLEELCEEFLAHPQGGAYLVEKTGLCIAYVRAHSRTPGANPKP